MPNVSFTRNVENIVAKVGSHLNDAQRLELKGRLEMLHPFALISLSVTQCTFMNSET